VGVAFVGGGARPLRPLDRRDLLVAAEEVVDGQGP